MTQFQRLYNLELKIRERISRAARGNFLSPWLLFWLLVGGVFFTFQAFLLLSPLAPPFTPQVEISAALIGLVIALAIGSLVVVFAPNRPTEWRLPTAIFIAWMLVPALFPLLFLIGVFLQEAALIDLQNSVLRSIVELILFGLGLTFLIQFARTKHWTQGSATIILFTLIFALKSIVTNGFYLANKCPNQVIDERYAWLSNTAEEVKMYRTHNTKEKFYKTPLGQFVCTRTQEDLFR